MYLVIGSVSLYDYPFFKKKEVLDLTYLRSGSTFCVSLFWCHTCIQFGVYFLLVELTTIHIVYNALAVVPSSLAKKKTAYNSFLDVYLPRLHVPDCIFKALQHMEYVHINEFVRYYYFLFVYFIIKRQIFEIYRFNHLHLIIYISVNLVRVHQLVRK